MPEYMTVRERLTNAYTEREGASDLATLRRLADTFQESPEMEALLKLRRDDPAKFDKVIGNIRMSLGFYLTAKEAHVAVAKADAEAAAEKEKEEKK
jgi:hypothetical protein